MDFSQLPLIKYIKLSSASCQRPDEKINKIFCKEEFGIVQSLYSVIFMPF